MSVNIELTIIILLTIIIFSLGILGWMYWRKVLKEKNVDSMRRMRLTAYQQKEYVDSVISVNDREGQRIAEDLHDEVGPMLTALKQYLDTSRIILDKGDTNKAKELLTESSALLKSIVKEVRAVSYNLSPAYMEKQGAFRAIGDFIEKIKKVSDIEIHYSYPGEIPMDKEIAMNIYKIALELMNNSLKHSGANSISLSFLLKENILTLNYKDNGMGFNEEEVFRSISLQQGLGLNTIQIRVNYINGSLINKSGKGKGVDYTIKIILMPDEKQS